MSAARMATGGYRKSYFIINQSRKFFIPNARCAVFGSECPPLWSVAVGVGSQPEKPRSLMRETEGTTRQISTPAGISTCFQISPNAGEPFLAVLACNLLSKDSWRTALSDEAVKSGPEVSFVGMALSLSSDRKRLTGTGAGPDGPIAPSCELERVCPPADASEEMCLVKSSDIICVHFQDAAAIDFASGNQFRVNQVAKPCANECVVIVVIDFHGIPSPPLALSGRGFSPRIRAPAP